MKKSIRMDNCRHMKEFNRLREKEEKRVSKVSLGSYCNRKHFLCASYATILTLCVPYLNKELVYAHWYQASEIGQALSLYLVACFFPKNSYSPVQSNNVNIWPETLSA